MSNSMEIRYNALKALRSELYDRYCRCLDRAGSVYMAPEGRESYYAKAAAIECAFRALDPELDRVEKIINAEPCQVSMADIDKWHADGFTLD